MTDTFVLTIDPGKSTGIALLVKSGDEVSIVWSRETDEFETGDLINATIRDHIGQDFHIAMEDFKITAQTGKNSQAVWSLWLIGVARYLCHAYGIDEPRLQPPSRAKEFVPNDRLKSLGIWHVGGGGHAKDALRHGVLYLVEKCAWRPANLLVK